MQPFKEPRTWPTTLPLTLLSHLKDMTLTLSSTVHTVHMLMSRLLQQYSSTLGGGDALCGDRVSLRLRDHGLHTHRLAPGN